MIDYNFLTLSPYEFENFTRDILQKHLAVYIESFKSGKDNGIDLRYTESRDKKVIIQAKRYDSYSSLLSALKKEVLKVDKLSPQRYILTTSAGLSPSNKEEIKNIFDPYIKNTEDIIGKDDLNNLLGQYKNIEQQYYKLWLSSTNILSTILHNNIHQQSIFEFEKIQEQVKLYVQNDSFNDAMSILNDYRYVIISGIPGIGKTTLARNLVLHYVLKEDYEFVYLSQIDDAYKLYSIGRKQVFLFDDFLGRNFFNERGAFKDDSQIINFIDKIERTPNKRIIITTREYILKQAKKAYESFKIKNVEIAKCTLDLASYTALIKAKILYNHLFFANVPIEYLQNIIEDKKYNTLINHPNYNPRIIQTIVENKIWNNCLPNEFSHLLISFFDNPTSVWEHIFENSLDTFTQYSLLVLLNMGTPVIIDDWRSAVEEFFRNNVSLNISVDSIKFEKTVKELESTFIKLQKDSFNGFAVEYQNPSIQDFLVYYIEKQDSIIKMLLSSAIYTNQFFTIFSIAKRQDGKIKKIVLNENLKDIVLERIINIFDNLRSGKALKCMSSDEWSFAWGREREYTYSFLYKLFKLFDNNNLKASEFIYAKFQELIYLEESNYYSEHEYYIKLLTELDLSKIKFETSKIFESFLNNIYWIDNFELIDKLRKRFPSFYTSNYEESIIHPLIKDIVQREIDSIEESDISDLKYKVETAQDVFNISLSDEINEIAEKIENYEKYIDSIPDDIRSNHSSYLEKFENEKLEIENLFDTFNSLS